MATPPSITAVVPGNGSVAITFTAASIPGDTVQYYGYQVSTSTDFSGAINIEFAPRDASSLTQTATQYWNGSSFVTLSNGTTYYFKVLAAFASAGWGGASAASGPVTPNNLPSAPTSLLATPGYTSVSIAFTAGSQGGSPISNYKYSTDGTNYTAFSPAQASSPVSITGLSSGTSYTVYLKAVNGAGDSPASSGVSFTTTNTPSAPTSLLATIGNQQVSIAFTPGANGGTPITNYSYSMNGGTSYTVFSPAQSSSPVVITGLTNGTSYTVYLKAINVNGSGAASAGVTFTPSTTPSAPTSLVSTKGDSSVSIAFTAGATGGSAITNYKWSSDGTNYTAFSPAQTSSPVSITGLTNGTSYTVYLKAVNANGDGVASAGTTFTPSTTPSAPTLNSYTPQDGAVQVSFTAGATGGSAITNYQYSTDNGASYASFSPAQTSSPVTISGLANGGTYNVILKAINANGLSPASNMISVVPSTTPSASTITSYTRQAGGIYLYYSVGSTGGAAITNYQVSTNNGSSFVTLSPAQFSSPLSITGLTDLTSYNVIIKAINSNGVGTASNTFTVFTSVAPSAPTSLVVTNQNQAARIDFTPGYDGGAGISNYQYSLDNGATFTAFSPVQYGSFVIISGLTNGNSYYIALKAVNSNGAGAASSAVLAQPVTLPSPPSSLVATLGNQSASIAFTAGDNGGRTINNYQYSIDGVNYVPFSPAQTSSPVVVSGLTNGTLYSITLKTVTSYGASSASPAVTVTPSTVPHPPTALVATPSNNQISIAFTPGYPEGAPVTNYQYSIDGGVTFTAFSPAQLVSPVLITGLTNGITYTIQLKEVNMDGPSLASASVMSAPGAVPAAPTALSSVDLYNGNISLSFTPGYNGGFNPINYQYSLDGGNTFTAFSPAQTSSPVIISGLINRTSYTIQLKAVNVVGVGAASASLSLYYMCFLEGTNILCFNGSKEEYRKIESLRKGDLVKTFMDGYKAIDTIGFTKVYNPGNAMRSKNRLYKCKKENYPSLTEDLVITGCHAILVDDITDVQKERLIEEQGKIYITDNHYRLIAMVDERAEPFQEEGLHTVWHLALENENYYYNYGIFANGLHVETTSKRMIKEQSGMTLVE